MNRYIKIEGDLLKSTDSFFQLPNNRDWYAVKDGAISQHNSLADVMFNNPDFIVFDRYDHAKPRPNFITWYFDSRMHQISQIPVGQWMRGEISLDGYGNRNIFKLQDPLGETRKIKLSRYLPNVPGELSKYISFNSYKDYDSSGNLSQAEV